MIYADLHAHSFLSAFQQRDGENDPMSRDPNEETSVWHQFPERHNLLHFLAEKLGITTYSESDFTQGALAGVQLIQVSIYPPERGFFELDNKTFLEKIIELIKPVENFTEVHLSHFISGFSIPNIKHIKSGAYSYINETLEQARFITGTHPYSPDPDRCLGSLYSSIKKARYVLLARGDKATTPLLEQLIQVVLSVEGGNAFWDNLIFDGRLWNGSNFGDHTSNENIQAYKVLNDADYRNTINPQMVENEPQNMNPLIPQPVCNAVMANADRLLNSVPLFSFTFAHHFYNGLCGHCDSLQPLTDRKLVNQSFGKGSDITNLGYMIMNRLMAKNIIIDVKHMSWKARQSFYRYRANHYPQVPVMASHAAVNGFKNKKELDEWLLTHDHDSQVKPFYKWELNLFDEDIFEIVRSHGLIGVLMDERVNNVKGSKSLDSLWMQFRYIAEKAAEGRAFNSDQTVWDNLCLGTDYDGVINPVDEWDTYQALVNNRNRIGQDFYHFLLSHVREYMKQPPANFLDRDKLMPEEIVIKICYRNMTDFVNKHYR